MLPAGRRLPRAPTTRRGVGRRAIVGRVIVARRRPGGVGAVVRRAAFAHFVFGLRRSIDGRGGFSRRNAEPRRTRLLRSRRNGWRLGRRGRQGDEPAESPPHGNGRGETQTQIQDRHQKNVPNHGLDPADRSPRLCCPGARVSNNLAARSDRISARDFGIKGFRGKTCELQIPKSRNLSLCAVRPISSPLSIARTTSLLFDGSLGDANRPYSRRTAHPAPFRRRPPPGPGKHWCGGARKSAAAIS
jgi:hypothetical protein